MFMGFMTILIVATVPLLGGDLGRLATIRMRRAGLLFAALLVQILITDVIPGGPRLLLVGLHLASYVAAGAAIWANRRLPGLAVLAIGAALNATTIALNGGTLPASSGALARAGIANAPHEFANSTTVPHPTFAWLGDIVVTPSWLPFRNVVSVGDMIILLGATVLVHGVCRTVPARLVRRDADADRTATGVARADAPEPV